MRLYALLALVCPHSFVLKVFLIAFVGTHIPLLATVAFIAATSSGSFPWVLVCVLLGATLFGTALTLYLLRLLVQPILSTSAAANEYHSTRTVPKLPRFYEDEVGTLMREVQALIEYSEAALLATKQLSLVDPLTGLRNRRGFENAVKQMVAAKSPGILAMIDCDHFKAVNDTFGHLVGDQVLQRVAATLSRTISRRDIAARFGGDEFIALIHNDNGDVQIVAERLRAELSHIVVPGSPRPMKCSVGMVEFSSDHTIDDAIAAADQALFMLKRKRPTGPSRWPTFDNAVSHGADGGAESRR